MIASDEHSLSPLFPLFSLPFLLSSPLLLFNVYTGNEEYTPYSRPPLSKQLWFYEDHQAAKQLKFKASWSGGKEVE